MQKLIGGPGRWLLGARDTKGSSVCAAAKPPVRRRAKVFPLQMVDVSQDSTGTLWFSTDGRGLYRFRDGRFKAITTKDGLPSNDIGPVREDGKGNLWVGSNQGIFRLSLKELNDVADGKISSISPVSYGVAEGMRSSECNGGNPGVWQTTRRADMVSYRARRGGD